MYNSQIISTNLSKVQPSLNFKLVYHSVEEVLQAVDHINNLIEIDLYNETVKEGKSKVIIKFKSASSKKEFYSKSIQEFITNETLISKFDCFYWMERYYKICDIRNEFIQYKPLIPQLIWASILSKLEGLERAIRLLVEKARQTTCTTFFQGVSQHRLQFYTDVKSMIASKDETSSGKLAQIFIDSLNHQPFWLRSHTNSFETGKFWQFDNGSRLDLGWGTQRSLAKGTTPTVAHLSEIASFKYPEESIENALIRAMHETTRLLQIFEGTAEAREDYFHRKVKTTIEEMKSGITSLYFSFIPYFLREDIYPPPAYIPARSEAFSNYIPSERVLAHARKAEAWIKSNSDIRKIIGSNYKMPIETMFWYDIEYSKAEKAGELHIFLSQVPSDYEEAFQHPGKTIWPIQIISYHQDQALSNIPEVYKLKGDSSEVPPEFWPDEDEILVGGNTITIEPRFTDSMPASQFELVQIRFDGWDSFDPLNKFLIWEHPRRGFNYGSGVDTSDGLGKGISDNFVIQIFRNGTVEHKDSQVCEFASPDLSQTIAWPFLLAISTYYSQWEQLLLAIEDNKGFELQNAMINRGWNNLFQKIDEGSPRQSESLRFGFHTDGRSRKALIDHFGSFILGKWADLNSLALINELKDLQKARSTNPNAYNRDKITSGKDNLDDRFMASGICLYALHRNGILGFQKAAWEERQKKENSKFELQEFPGYPFEQAKVIDDGSFIHLIGEEDFVSDYYSNL